MSRWAQRYENGHKSWPPSAAVTALLHYELAKNLIAYLHVSPLFYTYKSHA